MVVKTVAMSSFKKQQVKSLKLFLGVRLNIKVT